MAGVAGFEPTNARIKIWCLTTWRYPNVYVIFSIYLLAQNILIFYTIKMAEVVGLEPTMTRVRVWRLTNLAIPQNMVRPEGFEPPAFRFEVCHSIQLSYRRIYQLNHKNGAGEGNRTLATGLEGQGSTTELHPHILLWSGRRDLNPRPSPWQGDTLPLSHFRR